MSDRMELIKRYQAIQRSLEEYADAGRPTCPLLAGDLESLAEQLGVVPAARQFLDELKERRQTTPGPFSGVPK